MTTKNSSSRCQAMTKSGKPCRAAAMAGGLCYFHANPNKASELGRIGGQKNRRVSVEPIDSIPALDTAIAVRNKTAELIEGISSGRVDPRIGSGLAPLLSLQLRAIETTNLERRIEELEKRQPETEPQEADVDSKGSGRTM